MILFCRTAAPKGLSFAVKRFTSTKQSASFLPPQKKRALISLYHHCDTFVTEENLSDRIDQAFLRTPVDLGTKSRNNTTDVGDLDRIRSLQRRGYKFSDWDDPREKHGMNLSSSLSFSDGFTSYREMQVIEALHGVDVSDGQRKLPGLEVLEDMTISEDMTKKRRKGRQ
jgi:hypothetical protein